ncbi:MAG: MgtC/SapB family protein [Candidatus Thermoplasmatota archaeon]|nr:MgtC/SapB family protein [Candidatus Thermoplasmatota archaeon]MBS3789838.1 MgtC/SapB family protein [Candidatus Thermoplasmatota archaeon]
MVISLTHIISFLSAVLIGLITGLERTSRASKEDEIKGAGIRTFALVSMVGFLVTFVFKNEVELLLITVLIFSFLFISLPILRRIKGSTGLTTSNALLLVFLIGMIFGLGRPILGVVSGISLLILTSSKSILHNFADVLSKKDLMSAVRFLIVAIILVPIIYALGPIHPLIGPGRVFDPLQALMMVLFVSSISFLSYVVMKVLGPGKGLQISGFIGGLVSSAAATASISEKCENITGELNSPGVSILLANTSMFIKDYVIIFTVAGYVLARDFFLPIILLLFVTGTFILFFRKKRDLMSTNSDSLEIDLGTPFALMPAVKFAILFSLIWVSSYLLQNYLGGTGVYMVSIGGLISTTSVSASISSLYIAGEIGALTALSTMLLAFGLGSISKVLIVRAYNKRLAEKVTFPMLALGTISFILVLLLN